MASPLDRLQSQFQIGGQIGRTSAEEVQSLAAKSGRQAPPVQPMETAVIGGTPSQAKMAGSSANLQRSLKVSAGEQELPTYLRRLQAVRPLLEEEQGRIDRARSMGQLNSLEERVQAAALSTIRTAPSAGAILSVNDDALPSTLIDGDDPSKPRTTARSLLGKVAAGTATDADYSALMPLLGFGADKSLDDVKKDIKQKYITNPEEEMEKAAADGTPDSLLASQINAQELGFNNWAEIAELLKLPPEMDIATLTVQQLTDQIYKVQAEEYSRTSALLRIINDPNMGPAEKEAARRQLEQLGATGVIAAEADVSNLASQIDDINTVTIAGREYTVSELLADKTITSLVDDYLKNPERADAIREAAPAFAAWIDSNKTNLENIVGKIDPGVQAVATVIQDNNKLQRPAEGLSLKDGVMSALYGNKWKTSTTALQPPAIYTTLRTFPDTAVRQNLTNLMNSLENRPEDLIELAGMDEATLSQKGLLTAEGIQRYQAYINSSYNLANSKSTDGVIGSIFGDEIKQPELEKLLSDVKALNDSNLVDDITPEQEQLLSIFDGDKDGKIDDTATILQNAKSLFAGKSLKDLARGSNDVKSGSDLLSSLRQKIDGARSDRLVMTYGNLLADGKIADDEIAELDNTAAPIADLQTMLDRGVPGAGKLQGLIDKKSAEEANIIRASSDVGITDAEMNATFSNPWQGSVTMLDNADKLKAYISSEKFDKLMPSVKTQVYAIYDKIVNRAVEENDKFIQQNMRRVFDREISEPGSALDREIAKLETQLRAGAPAKYAPYEKERYLAKIQAQINDAKERQRQLDASVPAITQRIMDEGRATYKSPRLDSMKGWRK